MRLHIFICFIISSYLLSSVFPYDYVVSYRMTEAVTEIPPQECFYSKLTNTPLSDEDYAFAKEMWAYSGCQSLSQFMELYCITDTLLLACCIISRRTDIYQKFGLDMCQFISGPQLSYKILTSTLRYKVELLDDASMYQFFESGIRGGVSQAALRYCKNSQEDEYDPEKGDTFVLLDAVR